MWALSRQQKNSIDTAWVRVSKFISYWAIFFFYERLGGDTREYHCYSLGRAKLISMSLSARARARTEAKFRHRARSAKILKFRHRLLLKNRSENGTHDL